ncbi:hypothetical protein PRNP1_007203 [Phytophthora ramorum]
MELPSSTSSATLKRTGRPVHPLWAHFHRGEKRNRYHYHAYCSYCVDRYGLDHVPPTRGVSSDMLRHLESCPNCPRKVVDSVKELCGRRERNAHARKQNHNNGGGPNNGSNGLDAAVDGEDDDQVLLLDVSAAATAAAASVATMAETEATSVGAAAVIATAAGTEMDVQSDTRVAAKRTASEALPDETSVRVDEMPRLGPVNGSTESGTRTSDKSGHNAARDGGVGFLTMTTKRGRTDSGSAVERTGDEDPMSRWRMGLLQTAVVSGIPLSAFQNLEFQELLQVLSPVRVGSDAEISSALHYSDAITAMCSSQGEGGSALAPLALRELVLGNNGQFWKTQRELAVLLAPLREAYSLVFQPKAQFGEVGNGYDYDNECATTVHGGLTLAHMMYQLGRMSQQYAALAESATLSSMPSSNNRGDTTVVAHRLHELLDAMWQRYDLPTMVLAFVFDFHMDISRLDMSNSSLQWKAVASYFQLYFQRWFCQAEESQNQSSKDMPPISSDKIDGLLSSYQLHQFPFDADTTNCYTDVSSFYSFISDSHPEICALCCRVYAIALACVDIRRVVRGLGFVPPIAQTSERPEQVELLLHVGFATSLKNSRRPVAVDSSNTLSELLQASRPEELICNQEDWETFSFDWKQLLDHELAMDELEQLQQLQGFGSRQSKSDNPFDSRLPLDQLFFEVLPPLPAAIVVAPSPHDPAGAATPASVDL